MYTRDHLSDHRRITFRLDTEAQAQLPQIWATKKADWRKFSTLMGDRSSNFKPHRSCTAKTLDRETRLFYNDLEEVGLLIMVRPRQTNPWWSAELSLQRSKVRHLQQLVMKHRDDFSLCVQYKQARNNFCKAIRMAKKLSWKTFIEHASNLDGMLKLSRAILQKWQPQIRHLNKRDCYYTQTREEILPSS